LIDLSSAGSAFQTAGPAKENTPSANLDTVDVTLSEISM